MRRTRDDPPDLPGFEFVRALGSGGFADVFLFEQRLPRRPVAIKVLGGDLDEEQRARFESEANLMAALSSHPNIVTIYGVDVAPNGRPYLLLEYCPGPTMSDRYKQEPLPVPEVLRVGVRVASALAAAHSAGILHRDIKPSNILTSEYGHPLLGDFGISALIATTQDDAGATGSGGASSTATEGMSIPWAPPELFASTGVYDARSDVYALGATLYTLLAGVAPFAAPTRSRSPSELVERIRAGEITPLTRTDVPPEVLAVVTKAMARDPEHRQRSALELARALQACELSLGFAATPVDIASGAPVIERTDAGDPDELTSYRAESVPRDEAPAQGRPPRPPRSRNRVIALVVALVAVLLVVGVPAAMVIANPRWLGDTIAQLTYRPTQSLSAVMSAATLTPAGERIVTAGQATEATGDVFNTHCPSTIAGVGRLACTGDDGTMMIYDVTDADLAGFEVAALAHAVLDAAWDSMAVADRDAIGELLEPELSRLGDRADVENALLFGQRVEGRDATAEAWAVLGTQVEALPEALEERYADYFEDRAAVVAAFTEALDALTETTDAVAALQGEIADEAAALDAEWVSFSAQNDALIAAENALAQQVFYSEEDLNAAVAAMDAQWQQLDARWVSLNEREILLAEKSEQLTAAMDLVASQYAAINVTAPESVPGAS